MAHRQSVQYKEEPGVAAAGDHVSTHSHFHYPSCNKQPLGTALSNFVKLLLLHFNAQVALLHRNSNPKSRKAVDFGMPVAGSNPGDGIGVLAALQASMAF